MSGDRDFIQILDAALAESARRSGEWLVCKLGCTECCIGPFPITQLDAVRLREGQNVGFNPASQHGVWRLQAGDRRDLLPAFHLVHIEVRHTDPAHLALLAKAREQLPRRFDLVIGIGPVDLVEVNGLHAQPAQRGMQLLG